MNFLPFTVARAVDEALEAWREVLERRYGRVSWAVYHTHEQVAWGLDPWR